MTGVELFGWARLAMNLADKLTRENRPATVEELQELGLDAHSSVDQLEQLIANKRAAGEIA